MTSKVLMFVQVLKCEYTPEKSKNTQNVQLMYWNIALALLSLGW